MPPLVLVAVAWLAGLVVAHHWPAPSGVPTTPLLLLSLLPLALLVLWWRDRDLRLAAFCALALLAATLRYDAVLSDWQDPDFVARYNDDGWVRLEGVVAAYPDARDTWTNLTLEVEAIEIEGQRRVATGQVLVRAPRYPAYAYGDRLWVSGLMETPPELEGYSYREYLGRQGIHSLIYRPQIEKVGEGEGSRLKAALFDLKDRAYEAMGRLVPDPEAALLQGIVLGAKTGIPKDLYDEYNTTGTSHIIVMSESVVYQGLCHAGEKPIRATALFSQ